MITAIREKGFQIKVGGLYGFVSFNHMPWQYNSPKYWKAISSELIDRKFFCKIPKLSKEPIKILIDAKVHNFSELIFKEKIEVQGIVIGKTKYGLFIEFGHFFNWKHGSCLGLLHKNNVAEYHLLEKKQFGENIDVIFHGFTKGNKIILGDNSPITEWLTGELDKYVGTTQNITVRTNEHGNRFFFLENKYPVQLPITKSLYPEKNKPKIKSLLKLVKNNEIITCEIVRINYKKNKITARWLINVEPPLPKKNNSIINQIPKRKNKNLLNLLVDKEIEVRVFTKDHNLGIDENKYFILNNIETKLTIKSYSYKLSERDIGIIETNFKNGELIKCIVSRVGKEIEVEYYIDRINRNVWQ